MEIFVDQRIVKKLALVFGTEIEGISETVFEHADEFVKIPMYGFTENYLKIVYPFNESLVNKLTIVTPNALTEDGFVGIEVIEPIPSV